MSLKWIRSRKTLVAAGILLMGWATLSFESESMASGVFLTDRIGEGSVLIAQAPLRQSLNSRIVYFQDGHPVSLAQLKADEAYCRFTSLKQKLGASLRQQPRLVVRFRNVARARWFFDHGIQLECAGPEERPIRESEFQKTLGSFFQIEKHNDEGLAKGLERPFGQAV